MRPLTPGQLASYLDRIGVTGPVGPDRATLARLHRGHLLAIPYENLDIHLGRPVVLDVDAFHRKLVGDRRGGWCYEMNGLFGAALAAVGFRVRLLAGSVRLEGDHLLLLVELDRPYLADVGFGDGFLDPVPLVPGPFRQRGLEFSLERAGERWVVRNHPWGGAPSFTVDLSERRLEDFGARCDELQTSPESGFVQKTVCQRWTAEEIVTLRGALLRRVSAERRTERVLAGAAEYRAVLAEEFSLDHPELAGLWPTVWHRHLSWVAATG